MLSKASASDTDCVCPFPTVYSLNTANCNNSLSICYTVPVQCEAVSLAINGTTQYYYIYYVSRQTLPNVRFLEPGEPRFAALHYNAGLSHILLLSQILQLLQSQRAKGQQLPHVATTCSFLYSTQNPKVLTVLATAGLIDGSRHGDCGDGRG